MQRLLQIRYHSGQGSLTPIFVVVAIAGIMTTVVLLDRKADVIFDSPTTTEGKVATNSYEGLPESVLIRIPFTSQAPLLNWDAPYQEACEETSLLMVHHFLQRIGFDPVSADAEIVDLTEWVSADGFSEDITIRELAQVAQRRFGYTPYLYENPTIEDLKHLIASGNPVIVPVAGRKLKNPYFSGPGPWYHMLVLTGYDSTSFITNDPGTRRGFGYAYKYNVLYNAIHDWTGKKEDIEKGPIVVLVLR
ncbi:MAG: C39 family peptidase [bacterium]|nr:C39 family peptidase [bacterium]